MKELRGVIVTEPKSDNGRWRFTLAVEATQQRLPCLTGAGFSGVVPKIGTTVTVTGEHKADIVSGGESFDFVISTIQP
jgi:hypothetical protein